MFDKFKRLRDRRGQSLVAMALLAPILFFVLVGLVEVTQLVVTQNRVSTAARNAARYGANGGEDAGIRSTIMNTVTRTLVLSSGAWDIWSIRAEVDASGNIQADSFLFEHIYGDGLTEEYARVNTPAFEDELRLKVQEKLKKDNTGAVVDNLGADLSVVGTYILHDIETILGLNIVPNLVGFNTITGFSVMRRASLAATVYTTSGCRGVFPIVLEEHAQTLTESEYNALAFSWPITKPNWESFQGQPSSPTPLQSAAEGNIFKFDLGTGSTNFNWLKWNVDITGITPPPGGASILAASLNWPGNSSDYEDRGDPPGGGTYRGFADATDPADLEMHEDDWIVQDTISGGFAGMGVDNTLREHVNTERALRLVLWDDSASGYTPSRFQASGFGIFRLRAYGANWILLELVRIDNSCGQS
ncbi:MAG: TadE/TadG family type IV pilus assembly protein [Candidatus Promineifilaceae bacterium]